MRQQISMIPRRLDRQLIATILTHVTCLLVLGISYVIYSLCQLHIDISENDLHGLAIKRLIEVIILSLFYGYYLVNFDTFFQLLIGLFSF